MYTSEYLRFSEKEQTVIPYPPRLKNVTALASKMQNFYI